MSRSLLKSTTFIEMMLEEKGSSSPVKVDPLLRDSCNSIIFLRQIQGNLSNKYLKNSLIRLDSVPDRDEVDKRAGSDLFDLTRLCTSDLGSSKQVIQ
ncbi:hypothetical protein TNCV_1490761 [Trichonephila clavipes]|nr:hypothetical protein TNCV_1490761 [Trichonephila clavipes]